MNILSEILRTLYPSWWRLNFFPLTTRQKWKRQSPKTTSSNCEGWWGCHTGKYGSEMLGFSWAIQICISYFWHGLNKHSEPFCCVFFFGIAYPFERLLLLFFSSVYTLGRVSDPCSAYVHVWRLNPAIAISTCMSMSFEMPNIQQQSIFCSWLLGSGYSSGLASWLLEISL